MGPAMFAAARWWGRLSRPSLPTALAPRRQEQDGRASIRSIPWNNSRAAIGDIAKFLSRLGDMRKGTLLNFSVDWAIWREKGESGYCYLSRLGNMESVRPESSRFRSLPTPCRYIVMSPIPVYSNVPNPNVPNPNVPNPQS
jgi:hypothetical protein